MSEEKNATGLSGRDKGAIAYAVYRKARGFKDAKGHEMLGFSYLSEEDQRAWEAVAELQIAEGDLEMTPELMAHIKEVKQCRVDSDWALQQIKKLPSSREVSLSITNIQQGIMWLGMELKRLGSPNPYPSSYNPSNSRIEPTGDGLKL